MRRGNSQSLYEVMLEEGILRCCDLNSMSVGRDVEQTRDRASSKTLRIISSLDSFHPLL